VALVQVPAPELGITVGDFNRDGLLGFIFQSNLGIYVFSQQ
jgi:hypothetical protein